MFWWIHGIFAGIAAVFWVTLLLSYVRGETEYSKNTVLNTIYNMNMGIVGITMIGFPLIEAFIGLAYALKLPQTNEEYALEWIENHPNINIDVYRESMNNSFTTGWWIALGIVAAFIVAVLIAETVEYNRSSTQRELEKVRQAYSKALNSKIPEIKAMAPVLENTIKKIELQEEMKAMSTAIKVVKKLQKNKDYIDVQKEIDELNAMHELDNLADKYAKPLI